MTETLSSRKYKKNIQKMDDKISSRIYGLEPSSFIYKDDASNSVSYGLIAEDVYKIMPDIVTTKRDLVTRKISDKRPNGAVVEYDVQVPQGDLYPYGIQYEKLLPFLLNEVISLRRELDELKNK